MGFADSGEIAEFIKRLFPVQIDFNTNIVRGNILPVCAPERSVVAVQNILRREGRIAPAVSRLFAVGRSCHAFPGQFL